MGLLQAQSASRLAGAACAGEVRHHHAGTVSWRRRGCGRRRPRCRAGTCGRLRKIFQ
jgi:hypothetical protein